MALAETRPDGGESVRWGILGPLLVVDDSGAEIRLPAGRLRVLLAALLTRANQVVSLDELGEIVWDGAPPPDAARTIRVYVTRLRRALGPAIAARIVTRVPGYQCRTADDELDVLRFETLCRDGRTAARAREWRTAAALLAEAVDLWRGTPLADVSSDLLGERELARLEQHRLQAVEDHVDAQLHLGHHQQVISSLRDLTGQHPLRERFHAQLMVALAHSGRQAEALTAYQDARRVLADQLGIEPGAELRRLHERILAGDADLLAPPAPPPPSSAVVPRQLPAAPGHFTGRHTELATLLSLAGGAAAAGTVVISAIDGMAGIGKTALAVHAAHRLAGSFPDGQLFVDLHGYTQGYSPRSAGEALDAFLGALGVPPQQVPRDVEARAGLYRQHLAGTRTLIVLDNAADEAQVRPLLPGSAGCLLLVTSRRRLKGLDDAHPLPLDVLSEADALALLRTVAGPERVPADDPVLAEIAGLCGRLPLALRIAAALLRHRPTWSLAHLAGLLHDERHRVSALADGDRDLSAVFDLSYRNLTDVQRRLFRYVAVSHGPDVDAFAVAALTGTDPFAAGRRLEELVDHNLLVAHVPGRYRLHDLVRLYARALADRDPADDREAATGRLLDYYQHTAARADALVARYTRSRPTGPAPAHVPDLPNPDAAWTWLRTERANLLAALDHTVTRAQHARTVALTAGLANLLRTDGPWSQAVSMHTTAISAAEHCGDQRAHADALIDLGLVRRLVGDLTGAERDLQESLGILREIGDRLGQANALAELGTVRAVTGDLPGAAEDFQAGLDIFREIGDRTGQALALTQLGDARAFAGDLPGAARDLRSSLDIFGEIDDRIGQANALIRLGYVWQLTGDLKGAARDLQAGLDIFREIGHRTGQANALARLGTVRRLSGELRDAAGALREALEICREIGERNGQALAVTELGSVQRETGDLEGAASSLREGLEIFREIGARGNQAWALNHYAAVVTATGDVTGGQSLYREALHLANETRQPDEQALALEGLGECHLRTDDLRTGAGHLEQALEIFERLGMRPDADRVRSRLSTTRG